MTGRLPPPCGLVLRPPQRGEAPALIALYDHTFAAYGPPGGLHGVGLVVAELDGEIVGLGRSEPVDGKLAREVEALKRDHPRMRRLVPVEQLPVVRRGDYVLTALAVVPEHRGEGIGRALAEGRIEAAELAGAHHLFVHCVQGAGSRELYASLGFVALGEADRWYRSGHGMTLMAASLPRGA